MHTLSGVDMEVHTSSKPAADKVKELSTTLDEEGGAVKCNLDKLKSMANRSFSRGIDNVSGTLQPASCAVPQLAGHACV